MSKSTHLEAPMDNMELMQELIDEIERSLISEH